MDTGPASAVMAIPLLGFLKLLGLTGTGFAQPKPNSKRNSAPNGSTLAMGLKVKRPWYLAVLSPSLYATHPWANSCKGKIQKMTNNTATICIRILIKSTEPPLNNERMTLNSIKTRSF